MTPCAGEGRRDRERPVRHLQVSQDSWCNPEMIETINRPSRVRIQPSARATRRVGGVVVRWLRAQVWVDGRASACGRAPTAASSRPSRLNGTDRVHEYGAYTSRRPRHVRVLPPSTPLRICARHMQVFNIVIVEAIFWKTVQQRKQPPPPPRRATIRSSSRNRRIFAVPCQSSSAAPATARGRVGG